MIIVDMKTRTRARIADGVIGQLSDGMWENSPGMDKYWRFMTVQGFELHCNNERWDSGFRGKNEEWVKNWLAGKIKQVCQYQVGNDEEGWKRDNMEESWLHGSISECYECYDWLKGRNTSKWVYGFQQEENQPTYISLKNIIKKTITDNCKKLDLEFTDELNTWISSVEDYYLHEHKRLFASGFDKKVFDELEDNKQSEKYGLAWPRVAAAAVIIDKIMRQNPNYLLDITQQQGLTMSPEDCFKAIYYDNDGMRDEMFGKIFTEFTTKPQGE